MYAFLSVAALLATLTLPAAAKPIYPNDFRTIDGTGNHPTQTTWGSAHVELRRMMSPDYADGVSMPPSSGLPSAREVSNVVFDSPGQLLNVYLASSFFWQWGQFLDHDIDLTPGQAPSESFDIPVPMGDPHFDPFSTGSQMISMSRSMYTETSGVREQMNVITSFIDASNVYGSDSLRAFTLRANDGTGRLATSAGDLLPFNTAGLPNAPTSADPTLFLAGDERANEQVGLTAMHTLFVREHNYWADEIRTAEPLLTGDEVYERARAIVAAEMQIITYREFLPLLLGPNALNALRRLSGQRGSGHCQRVLDGGLSIWSHHAAERVVALRLEHWRDHRGSPTPQGCVLLADAVDGRRRYRASAARTGIPAGA